MNSSSCFTNASTTKMSDTCDDKLETLRIMLRQETNYYQKEDFRAMQKKSIQAVHSAHPAHTIDHIDTTCRTKMCHWFQQICTFCQYDDMDESTLIIENAMNFLDRYVVTPKGSVALLDRNYYQVTAITCLYMAAKIHASAAISANDMSQITRNVYNSQQIEDTEYRILQALQWHVNPPTTSVFVSEYVKSMISHSHPTFHAEASFVACLQSVVDIAHTRIATTICEEKFMTIPASIIAYTAIVHAMQSLAVLHEFEQPLLAIFASLSQLFGTGQTETMIQLVNEHLTRSIHPSLSSSDDAPVKAATTSTALRQEMTPSPLGTASIVLISS
jgi:Cyclin, N-terminal domain